MKTIWLQMILRSEATFGRGDGLAGVVDAEVQHDAYGLPFLGGKTIKGMLAALGDEILFALSLSSPAHFATWQAVDRRLFGQPGSDATKVGILHVGNGQIPEAVCSAIAYSQNVEGLRPQEILEAFTTLRRQTAMDAVTGAPQHETLRTLRVILRHTVFVAQLNFTDSPSPQELAWLATCVKGWRRAGSGRNRGRGRLQAELYDAYPGDDPAVVACTHQHFDLWQREVMI